MNRPEPALASAPPRLGRRHLPLPDDPLPAPPDDPGTLQALAAAAARQGRHGEAGALLARALAAAPGLGAARFSLAHNLYRQKRFEAALAELDRLLAREPGSLSYLNLRAACLARLLRYEEAIALYQAMLARAPGNARLWMRYGHLLRTVGQAAECVVAYRQTIAHAPALGEAWWSLANLKTVRFEPGDVAAMADALARPDLREEDRIHFHFALGKALEDDGRYRGAFDHYARGNAAHRARVDWDGEANREHALACERVLTAAFFAERRGAGCEADDPIFIVGLPRAGSTLIEQILASHSQVEGTMELPDLALLARRLGETRPAGGAPGYLAAAAALPPGAFARWGRAYLGRTRTYRKTAKPRFVDKMPDNFALVGLIHLILPNATIVDARRHPMATCFSAWKQHFTRGQAFTYDLGELGRYYRDYVRLMDHYDRVLPGRVLRVHYENLVVDTEAQVRRLLDHCGLQFEPGCLAFHQNSRAVRTASSEQVRRPISLEGLHHWRHFAPWLGDIEAELSGCGPKQRPLPTHTAGPA